VQRAPERSRDARPSAPQRRDRTAEIAGGPIELAGRLVPITLPDQRRGLLTESGPGPD
jgi:hypothetical protein